MNDKLCPYKAQYCNLANPCPFREEGWLWNSYQEKGQMAQKAQFCKHKGHPYQPTSSQLHPAPTLPPREPSPGRFHIPEPPTRRERNVASRRGA